jgi:hypothetical protein
MSILTGLFFALPFTATGQVHAGAGPSAAPVHGVAPGAAPAAASGAAHASVAPSSARVGSTVHRANSPSAVGAGNIRRIHTGTIAGRPTTSSAGFGTLPGFSGNSAEVPGLGFDYVHAAAVNSGRGRHGAGHFDAGFPLGFSGFLLSPIVSVEQVLPATEEQGPAEESAATGNGDADSSVSAMEPNVSADILGTPAPQGPSAEYVFVRRDGSLLFAVAYSWDHGTLRYVTREGLRRSVMQESLDMDATQQFNEQRGLNFRSPA